VLRFYQEWVYRAQRQLIAVRSQFSLGISAFGSTTHSDGAPNSQFFAWLLQLQGANRIELLDMQTIFHLESQLTSQSLLPLEQLSVGGRYSVRAYRTNELVRDNGIIASLEQRLPVFRNKPWADLLELAAFVDFGYARNNKIATSNVNTLASVGLGLRWEKTFGYPFPWRPQFEIYWGVRLRDVNTTGSSLQDQGIYFQFMIAAF
jgi:hemolysin activation/secretion protein